MLPRGLVWLSKYVLPYAAFALYLHLCNLGVKKNEWINSQVRGTDEMLQQGARLTGEFR